MIIEFFGIPGSGKTTTRKRLVSKLKNAEYITVQSKVAVMGYVGLCILIHPRVSIYWMYALWINYRKGLGRYKLSLVLRSMATTMKARLLNRKNRILFIDEGLLQRSLSVWEHILEKHACESVIRHILVPDMVLVFCEGTFVRFTHMYDASASPRYKQGKQYLTHWMSLVRHNTTALFTHIATHTAYIVYPDLFADHEGVDARVVQKIEDYRHV